VAPAPPQKQQQRSVQTRAKLLRATIACVAQYGYVGATMDRIVAEAAVSRGAQGHHFPTKSLLMQAALQFNLDLMIADIRLQTELIRERGDPPAEIFRHLWATCFSKDTFAFTLELIVASRTDPELRGALIPVTERFREQIDESLQILNGGSEMGIPNATNLSMSLLRGLGIEMVLFGHPDYFQRQIDSWSDLLSAPRASLDA